MEFPAEQAKFTLLTLSETLGHGDADVRIVKVGVHANQ
jgi:hypothetical protein